MNSDDSLIAARSIAATQIPITAVQPRLVDILLPNRFAIGFVVLLAFLLFWLPEIFLNDGATLRHLNNGLYILKNGVIPQTNFDWFVNPKAPILPLSCGQIFFLPRFIA